MTQTQKLVSTKLFAINDLIFIFSLLILSVDVGIFLMHIFAEFSSFGRSVHNLNHDWSAGEIFQYIKEAWIGILLVYIAIKQKFLGYIFWALLFFYILCDDSLGVHEKSGKYFSSLFGMGDISTMNTLELFIRSNVSMIVPAIFCSTVLVGVAYFYRKEDILFNARTRTYLILFTLLVLCSALLDSLAFAFAHGEPSSFYLETLENGGEMFVMSTILIFTLKNWLEDY